MASGCDGREECNRHSVSCLVLTIPLLYTQPLEYESYRLLDYLYTAIHQGHLDGSPVLNAYWFLYPNDPNTFAIDSQFFFGDSILV